jgi:8-oxo-dGTP pyrophosphatase MutT (NUDIX family)
MNKGRAEREVSAGGIVFRRIPGEPTRFLLIRDPYRNWVFPKGHLEDGETPAEAAHRETCEETGLEQLILHGPIRLIDWHFRFRGRRIHKYCHFFLFESPDGTPVPQESEGISDYRWLPLDKALKKLSYDNARGVLKRGGEMARTLIAVGEGRSKKRGGGAAGQRGDDPGRGDEHAQDAVEPTEDDGATNNGPAALQPSRPASPPRSPAAPPPR